MSNPNPPTVKISFNPNFREDYANSVQIRMSVWDFLLTFGRLQQQTPEVVEVTQFQNIYLSPQQAKALHGIEREHMMRKAREADIASHMNEWLTSPGLQTPK